MTLDEGPESASATLAGGSAGTGQGKDRDTNMDAVVSVTNQAQSPSTELTPSAAPLTSQGRSWNLPHAVWEVGHAV
jgi:hypothetical protein